MRIEHVSVRNLFGMFDHDIPVNLDSRITIVYGSNGIGKTILLTMIHGLFQSRFKVFYDMPFDEFRIEFDTQACITVRKEGKISSTLTDAASGDSNSGAPEIDHPILSISYQEPKSSEYRVYTLKSPEEYRRRYDEAVDSIADLTQFENDLWFDRTSGNFLSMEDVIEKYDLRSAIYAQDEEKWYRDLCRQINTGFIQAHRLQTRRAVVDPFMLPFSMRRERPTIPGSTVERYSREIATKMQDKFTDFGELSQRRDSSFPKRLIESDDAHRFGQDELRDKMVELETKRSELTRLGLLDKEQDAPDIPAIGNTTENLKALSIYVEDIEAKLAVFDEISEQLDILTDIIDRRFQFKTMSVNKRDGFVFVGKEGRPIPIENLSSGEQHELVLLYELLFRVERDSMILIDEPELSLHVKWQRNFLNDIQRITGSRQFDVLMATHSPQIIQDKFDWMVGLQNPEF